jgi:formate dehydrogenase major subunit
MESVKTTCPYCGCGCNFSLNVENGQIVSVTPLVEKTVNLGKLCLKGRFGFDFVHHRDRLKTPLIRKNGKLEEADWPEAISFIASKLKSIKEEFGPDSIAAFSSARCTNEENYLMQKFMRAVIGTNNIDHCARL